MKLELYSGKDLKEGPVDRLKRIFALEEPKLDAFVRTLVKEASTTGKTLPKDDMAKLKSDFGVDNDSSVDMIISTMLEVALRIYAGKMTLTAQDEMVRLGFSEKSVKTLPLILERLPQKEKDSLKFWAAEAKTIGDRNHLHAIASEPEVRTVVDKGNTVAVLPISVIRIRMKARDVKEEQLWRLELTYPEVEFLTHYLNIAKQELEASAQELKKRLGELVVTPP